MKRSHLILLAFAHVLMIASSSFGRNNLGVGYLWGDSVPVFAHANDSKPLHVYYSDTPGGIIFSDHNTDNYYPLSIIKQKNNRFLVEFSYIYAGGIKEKKAWIYAENVGCMLLRNPRQGQVSTNLVSIYDKPSHKSSSRNLLMNEAYYYMPVVIAARKGWLKIVVYENNSYLVGWLAPENQCDNMYTGCCGN